MTPPPLRRILPLLLIFALGCGPESTENAESTGEETTGNESGCEDTNAGCDDFPEGLFAHPIHVVDFAIDEATLETLLSETTEDHTAIVAMTLNGQTLNDVDLELHGYVRPSL